ncbi:MULTISPECIES: YbaK/EbsC family protein [unclassified Campylobacter]|uniref:YbaK/EbsC family protein n=1 Tax=unclassified Campylobacter TaxID=2593542 RepID=UPI0022E9E5C7|nr:MULTISPECIES: YbaK/EbsC family protein [unclassified Campylobacter]MDA3053782.1 YbaK/prolyl-tRNA synthetase associated domain-containing protein [Campylobacter sp. VBCF_07 NA4]MDA3060329.1 YbaK/prolyl-tRNA synthetase associated domain-containing protein [Campylobacter sp. VBCF_02 NA5]MDA3069839.1 YbaK/prolyl-tRNA synthetase associated domain-containing protein [Campylobacter sp. VBCF_08 NA3]WBR54834.1 YbaK/prolyl-tRNA synthetase associated domain-containing protein [Campylobacter sp. VBCF_01
MSEKIFNKIVEILEANGAKFRVVTHDSVGTSAEVAKVRGTELGQGAKALICTLKGGEEKIYALAVLPADMQADLGALARAFERNRASLVSPAEGLELSDCVFGSVPPFSFHEKLVLVCDPALFERYDEIAFNAGLLDHSVILDAKDYQKIANPKLVKFAKI